MIYASDLDRTLIYSKTFLDVHPYSGELTLVDKSKVNSYIATDVAVHFLDMQSRLKGAVKFIPVTTRSLVEYNRIKFPFENPEYAITSNGGHILHNGYELPEWKSYIQSEINSDELDNLVERVNELPGICYKTKIIDECYVFSKSDNIKETKIALSKLSEAYNGYDIYMHKHKVYVVPRAVNKGNAINWLKKYIHEDKIIASGDSDFDVPMLQAADISILPLHNNISDKNKQKLNFTEVGFGVESPLSTIKIIMDYGGNFDEYAKTRTNEHAESRSTTGES